MICFLSATSTLFSIIFHFHFSFFTLFSSSPGEVGRGRGTRRERMARCTSTNTSVWIPMVSKCVVVSSFSFLVSMNAHIPFLFRPFCSPTVSFTLPPLPFQFTSSPLPYTFSPFQLRYVRQYISHSRHLLLYFSVDLLYLYCINISTTFCRAHFPPSLINLPPFLYTVSGIIT